MWTALLAVEKPKLDGNHTPTKQGGEAVRYQPLLDDLIIQRPICGRATNAWIDAFKALLVRFEIKVRN